MSYALMVQPIFSNKPLTNKKNVIKRHLLTENDTFIESWTRLECLGPVRNS